MAVEVDNVIVVLEARLADYDRKLDGAQRHFDQTMRGIDATAGRAEARVTSAFRGVGTAAALLGVGVGTLAAAMVTGAGAATIYAASIAETGRATGLTAEQVQVLERAAIRNNFTMAQATNAIGDLNRKLGEARSGSESAVQAFRSIGITKEQLDSFRTAGQALPTVMDAIRSLRTESEQAAAANRVFGDSGEALLPLLRQGADGYNLVAEEARQAGLVTQEQADRAEEAKHRLQELALTLQTNLASALVDILPLIENAAAAFARLGGAAGSAFDWIRSVANQPGSLIPFAFAGFYGRSGSSTPGRNDASSGLIRSAMEQGLGPTTRLGPASVPHSRKPRGRRGPSAEELARREGEAERRFAFELAQIEQDIVAARAIQATSAEQVAQFEVRQIEAQRDRENSNYRAEAETARTNRATARARAEQLVEANNRLAAAKVANVNLEREERLREEALRAADEQLASDEEIARLNGQLAETRSAQRVSALELLDISLERRRLELEGIIASKTANEADKERARLALTRLNDIRAASTAVILRQNESPRDRYLRDINRTSEQISDDLERINSAGLDALNDGLADAIMGTKSLGEAFHDVAKQIISDLIRIAIQQAIIRPLANALFGGSGGGFGDIMSVFGGGRAAGGPVSPSKFYVVGEKGPELFVPQGQGSIIPQGRAITPVTGPAMPAPGAAAPQLITVRLENGSDWRAEVVGISQGVSVQVVQAAKPAIINESVNTTTRAMTRPRLNR